VGLVEAIEIGTEEEGVASFNIASEDRPISPSLRASRSSGIKKTIRVSPAALPNEGSTNAPPRTPVE